MDDNRKLAMKSSDLSDVKFAQLQALFPQVFTESKDENGEVVRAINTELLEQEINTKVLDGKKERYEFTWPDKRQAIRMANTPTNAALRPCREESVDFDTTENLYIEGDNLEVLKLLRETYLGKVKMIYIDPPYNTGNDFIYEDDFSESATSFLQRDGQFDDQGNRLVQNLQSNGRFHTDWLNMMYPRLKIARDLLTEDGVLLASVDDKEVHNLRRILDEVFNERNFVGNIAWESKTKSQNTKTAFNKLQPRVEHILCYTKSTGRRFNLIKKGQKEYPETDSVGKFRYAKIEVMNALGIRGRESMIYEILGVSPPEGRQWQLGIDVVNSFSKRGDLLLHNGAPTVKMRPDDERNEVTEPFWGFIAKEIGTAESAKKELSDTLGTSVHGFETVKPVQVMRKLIFHTTNMESDNIAKKKDDIVMDFFSGSSTTAHAVMQLNAEDGGKRKFIMVQLPEETPENSPARSAGFETISDIGKERIRRAGRKIKEESPITTADLDVGFRVLKLSSSNMKDVFYTPDETLQTDISFDGLVNNIKEDRSDEDLLFQVMLELGIPLSSKIEKKDGVFYVEETYLIACFQAVDNEQIKEIAQKEPQYVVFRDSSFANDSDSINFGQIFATYSPHTIRRVL